MFGGKRRARQREQQRRQETLTRLRDAGLLDTEPGPPSRLFELAAAALAVARRAVYRGRRVLTPVLVLAVLTVAAAVIVEREAPPAGVVVAAGVAVLGWWRWRSHRLNRPQERRYAAACLTAAAGWLLWASLAGPQWMVLVAGWTVLSGPWWAHHWPRPRVEVPDVGWLGDPVVARWDAHVTPNVRPLGGATLHDPTPFAHGTEYRVNGVPGRDAINAALGSLAGVASGLVTPITRIVLEPHPDYLDDDPNQGRLRVLTTSPVKATVIYDRPRAVHGKALLGPYADGMGDAVWRIYSENSMWGGLILGGSGSGKSRCLEGIALTARYLTALGQPTLIIYLDGQGGASSPLLWERASLRAGPNEAGLVLAGIKRAMVMRQKWNVAYGLDGFTPGVVPAGAPHALPGVLVIADECHKIFGSNTENWATVAREGRKVGFGLIGASQVNDLSAFGNNDALRSSLLAGNGLAFRTPTADAQRLIPGLLIDPAQLPEIPGYGYKIAAPQSKERTAPFRARYLPKRDDPALPAGVLPAEEWFDRTPDAPLDPMSARAIGDLYTRRHELAEQARTAMLAEIEGREPQVRELVVVGKTAAAATTGNDVSANVTTADAIVSLLAEHGPGKRADIAAHVEATVGTGPSAVKAALQKLLTERRVQRSEGQHGVYTLTTTGDRS